MYTPVNPSFTIYKLGVRGVFVTQTRLRDGKEATFIGVFTSTGYLKGHRVLISAAPNLGNKVICRYPGFTFQTFV